MDGWQVCLHAGLSANQPPNGKAQTLDRRPKMPNGVNPGVQNNMAAQTADQPDVGEAQGRNGFAHIER